MYIELALLLRTKRHEQLSDFGRESGHPKWSISEVLARASCTFSKLFSRSGKTDRGLVYFSSSHKTISADQSGQFASIHSRILFLYSRCLIFFCRYWERDEKFEAISWAYSIVTLDSVCLSWLQRISVAETFECVLLKGWETSKGT